MEVFPEHRQKPGCFAWSVKVQSLRPVHVNSNCYLKPFDHIIADKPHELLNQGSKYSQHLSDDKTFTSSRYLGIKDERMISLFAELKVLDYFII